MKANRTYQDSVFSLYWSDEKRLLELYNALVDGHYPDDTPVVITTLEGALYRDRINDVSFTLDDNVMVLIEHQSTVNHNMPLRMVIYFGRLLEKHLEQLRKGAAYRANVITVPTPRFFVLYTGKEPLKERDTSRLSPSLANVDPEKEENRTCSELVVEIFNINYGTHPAVLEKSDSLRQYSQFLYQVDIERENGKPLADAIKDAIIYCKEHNIMKDFLTEHGSEVENMLFSEWNMDTALKVEREEGREEGREIGHEESTQAVIKKLMHLDGFTAEKIADVVDRPIDFVREAMQKFANQGRC